MPLSLNDIVQVTFRGTLFGQRILNTFHYVVNVTGSGTAEAQLLQLATDLQNGAGSIPGFKSHFLDMIAIQYTLDSIRAQRVYPTRTVYQSVISGDVGQYAATDCQAANVSMVFTKRTSTPGRMGVGRNFIAGLASDAYSQGQISPATIGVPANVFKGDMLSSFTTSAPVVTFVPVLFNPTAPTQKFSVLTSVSIEDTLRVVHRRTLRVGE